MAHGDDFIPRSDLEFDQFFGHYCDVVDENTSGTSPLWPHIPRSAALTLRSSYSGFHKAYLKLQGPHTSGDVLAKKELKTAGEKELRAFNREYILSSRNVTDDQRRDIGCPVHDTTRTRIGTPKTVPLLTSLRAMSGHAVELRFQDETTPDTTAIPYGMNGCLLNYAWGPEKIEDPALLKETALMTHTPYTLTLPPAAEGSFLSCYVRWQNETGDLGKPSAIQHIVVS
ncbi:MAG: hypothetical protein LBL31_05030 [Spirochaetaceae bacterium]|jgi:hypothetical protein|nr:hypothetical protein [Spirochaetaceae bacterium]